MGLGVAERPALFGIAGSVLCTGVLWGPPVPQAGWQHPGLHHAGGNARKGARMASNVTPVQPCGGRQHPTDLISTELMRENPVVPERCLA